MLKASTPWSPFPKLGQKRSCLALYLHFPHPLGLCGCALSCSPWVYRGWWSHVHEAINFSDFVSVIPELLNAKWAMWPCVRPVIQCGFSQDSELWVLACPLSYFWQSLVTHRNTADNCVHLGLHPFMQGSVMVLYGFLWQCVSHRYVFSRPVNDFDDVPLELQYHSLKP